MLFNLSGSASPASQRASQASSSIWAISAYVSSMGLRSFVPIAKKLRDKGGELRICRLTGLVRQVFEITRLNQVFPSARLSRIGAYGGLSEGLAENTSIVDSGRKSRIARSCH